MKALLLGAALVAGAPTASDTFAIACQGDTLGTSVQDGNVKTQTFTLPDQIFVFSKSTGTALRAMPLRNEFERVCDFGSQGQQLEFSNDTIRTYATGDPDWEAKTSCEFVFEQPTNVATFTTRFQWSEKRRTETVWRMKCSGTAVPVFDVEDQ